MSKKSPINSYQQHKSTLIDPKHCEMCAELAKIAYHLPKPESIRDALYRLYGGAPEPREEASIVVEMETHYFPPIRGKVTTTAEGLTEEDVTDAMD